MKSQQISATKPSEGWSILNPFSDSVEPKGPEGGDCSGLSGIVLYDRLKWETIACGFEAEFPSKTLLLDPNQSGFKSGHSTEAAPFSVTDA